MSSWTTFIDSSRLSWLNASSPTKTSSRTLNHRSSRGAPTPSLQAEQDELLGIALIEAGVAPHLRTRWLALDAGFERAIVNQSPDECHGRYRTEKVIIVPKPDGF